MAAHPSVKIFLSAVSDEFGPYRDQLRCDLTRHNVEVKVQEDFKDLGGSTLEKLDVYIADCDAVVHLVGDMTGSEPGDIELRALLAKYADLADKLPPFGEALKDGAAISYTQWEAWLALYHDKSLHIAVAAEMAVRGPKYGPTERSRAAQRAHLARLGAVRRYPFCEFSSLDNLSKRILGTAVVDLLAKAQVQGVQRQPRNLPFASLGALFKGREGFLNELHQTLWQGSGQAAVTGKALHGLGGIGKTRLAIEYGWRYAGDYSALLFVSAETPELLTAGLAGLAGPEILDLLEKDAKEDAVRIPAALGWLERHPTWLMILDNVDDARAAAAVEALIPRLRGGHVLITARTTDFSGAIAPLPLDCLSVDESVAFLLERTDRKRSAARDDAALARELAHELGGLALGLEQAGAYIGKQRIGFARYLTLWRESREKVVGWFDRHLTSYNHDIGLAATWVTSVEKLTPMGRHLLDLCAFLAPEPIPDFLLDVDVPGAPENFDAYEARADLLSLSLAMPVEADDGKEKQPGFALHRLVQDFAQRRLDAKRRGEALRESLQWINAGFDGDPQDVRTWPRLDPLAPHALVVVKAADAARMAEPTATLMNNLGLLFDAKARYAEAEPLFRRALAINDATFGPAHHEVATDLSNLAGLLCATNRLAEAEPLFRRALAITEANEGPDHPGVATCLGNLAQLLQNTNRLAEAEPLLRRALAIDEASYGPNHPEVAVCLNNLAILLYTASRYAEAEPLFRRALAIDAASHGPDHPTVATRLNNLALSLKATNRLVEAEPLYYRALAIDEASYGPDHPTVATRLNNLALLLKATKRLAEAEPHYRRALAIDEASYGPDHPTVARDLNNLASLLKATNRLAEAEPLFRRALAIDEASLGSDHPTVARHLNNLAGLLCATNRLAEAEPLVRRALTIFEASLGPDHPSTRTVRDNLAELEAG